MLFNLSSKKEKKAGGETPPVISVNKEHKYDQKILELIRRRRLQTIVHSVIYYKYDCSIISDSAWSERAQELVELQEKYPEESKVVVYYDLFKDFDGSTGFNLIGLDWGIHTAKVLLKDKYGKDFVPEGGW